MIDCCQKYSYVSKKHFNKALELPPIPCIGCDLDFDWLLRENWPIKSILTTDLGNSHLTTNTYRFVLIELR